MNVFVFFFLTAAVVTAAPHTLLAADKRQHKSGKTGHSTSNVCVRESPKNISIQLLREIMNDVRNLKINLTETTLQKEVQYVFINEECSCVMLCRAGQVLSVFNHLELGLSRPRDWRLPRRLQAYSQMQDCRSSSKLAKVPLVQLLDKIHTCAQKEHTHI